MDTPYVREYVEDREITAWFLLDLSPSVDFGTAATRASEANGPDRLRDDARALADAARQPGRRRLLRRPGRAHDPGPWRPDPGPAPDQRPAARAAPPDVARDGPDAAAGGRPALDQGSLAGLRDLGLHQRPGMGTAAQPADPATRGPRGAALRPPRDGAARRRGADHGGCGDRRAALRRHPRQRLQAALSEAGEQREATLSDAFKRSGVDAVSLSTDEDLVEAIVRMASLRKRRRH